MVLDFLALLEAPPTTIRKLFENYSIFELFREGSQNNYSIFERFRRTVTLGVVLCGHCEITPNVISMFRQVLETITRAIETARCALSDPLDAASALEKEPFQNSAKTFLTESTRF